MTTKTRGHSMELSPISDEAMRDNERSIGYMDLWLQVPQFATLWGDIERMMAATISTTSIRTLQPVEIPLVGYATDWQRSMEIIGDDGGRVGVDVAVALGWTPWVRDWRQRVMALADGRPYIIEAAREVIEQRASKTPTAAPTKSIGRIAYAIESAKARESQQVEP